MRIGQKKKRVYSNFGELIRTRRLELGMSQCDLALEMGVTQGRIFDIEKNPMKNIMFCTICELSKALEMEPCELLEGLRYEIEYPEEE